MELRPSPSTLQYLFWHVVLLFDKAFDFVQICGYQNPLEVFFFRKSDFHHLLKNLLQCLIIALQTAHMPTTPPAQYTISEYPVSRLLFASHICSKGFHKAFLPCAADLQSLPFYGYDQLIHTLHMRQIYQIAVVALIVMPLRELFLGAFQ